MPCVLSQIYHSAHLPLAAGCLTLRLKWTAADSAELKILSCEISPDKTICPCQAALIPAASVEVSNHRYVRPRDSPSN